MSDLDGYSRPDGARRGVMDGQLSVLLVHGDIRTDKALFQALLRAAQRGLSVEFVLDARSALDRVARSEDFDAVVLDLGTMPGEIVAAAFLLSRAVPQIPLVAISRRGQEHAAIRAVAHGVGEILSPEDLHSDILDWRIRRAIRQHRLGSVLECHIAELEVNNSRFLSLVADNADAIVVVDKAGVIRFVNPSAEKLLRHSADDLLGQRFGVPLDSMGLREIDIAHHANGVRTAEIRVTETLWDGDRVSIVTMRDITERKRIELALKLAKQSAEHANAMKSQFLANMSHELRTPLNAIIGYAEVMLLDADQKPSVDRLLEYVRDIHQGGKHLLSLINDLLDLAKAESGKLELFEENFDLLDLAVRVGDIIMGDAMVHGVRFTLTIGSRTLWMRGDERMIKQALLNVLSNAIKFTPRGGAVDLRVERIPHGAARVIVSDTGIGIPRHQIPKAFAAFVQIENVYSRERNQGTGLGLALTKRFVELHNGCIAIDSDDGRGTRVKITLPRERVISSKAHDGSEISQIKAPPPGKARRAAGAQSAR